MKFEKLADNKIKIILNITDLKENNIDFHSFMSNSAETQGLFIDILKKAEKEVGFITSNYNIHIEAFATSDGNFIFNVTRMDLIEPPKKKKLVYKRKLARVNKKLSIYCFSTFDDYCDFCNFLSDKFNCYIGDSTLIYYNFNYYLILNNTKMDLTNLKVFYTYASEFGNLCTSSNLFLSILLEHGEKLISENAVEIGMHYL